ncbi:hypothetical protein KSA82_20985, partial [Acinetobacter baumannii]|nr:hypothetical protein [Acinetobacter baumannii]
ELPDTPTFSNRLDIYDLFWESDFSKLSYKAFMPETNSFTSGAIDEHGRTGKIGTPDPTNVQVLIGSDDEWGLLIDSFDEDDILEDQSINSNNSAIDNNIEDRG